MPAVSGDYDPDVGILLQVGILTGGTVQATRRDEDSGDSLTVAGTQSAGTRRHRRIENLHFAKTRG